MATFRRRSAARGVPIVVRGRVVSPQRVELDTPVRGVSGGVEFVLRRLGKAPAPSGEDFCEALERLPARQQTKRAIDRRLARERASWDRP